MPGKRSPPNLDQGLTLRLPAVGLPASVFPTLLVPASSDKLPSPNPRRGERKDTVGRKAACRNRRREVFLCLLREWRAVRGTSIRRRRESRERNDECEQLHRT